MRSLKLVLTLLLSSTLLVGCTLDSIDAKTALEMKEELIESAYEEFGDFEGVNTSIAYEIKSDEVQEQNDARESYDFHLVRAVTEKEVNRDETIEILRDILNNLDFDKSKDGVLVLLSDNDLLNRTGYSLGTVLYKNGEISRYNAYEKDWSKKPNKVEYDIYEEIQDRLEAGINKDLAYENLAEEMDLDIEKVKSAYDFVDKWKKLDI